MSVVAVLTSTKLCALFKTMETYRIWTMMEIMGDISGSSGVSVSVLTRHLFGQLSETHKIVI